MQQQFAGPRWVGTNQIRCWRLPANACAPRGIEYCQGAAIRVRGLGRPLPLRCRLSRGFLEGQTHVQYRSGDICDCQYVTFTVCDRETRRAASPTVQVKKWPDLRNGHGPLELSFRPRQRSTMGATKQYWEHARECARLAVETKDREEKHHLLDMAEAWTELALLEAGVVKGMSGRWATN